MSVIRTRIREWLPHAPDLGLYVAPHIPPRKLHRALKEIAPNVSPREVLAMYDATRLGTGGDGIVFTGDGFCYQNHNLQEPRCVAYREVVGTEVVHSFLKGTRLKVLVNPGRATVEHELDFSARPRAATYVKRLLDELALLREEVRKPAGEERTDWEAVRQALLALKEQGQLSSTDFERILQLERETKPE